MIAPSPHPPLNPKDLGEVHPNRGGYCAASPKRSVGDKPPSVASTPQGVEGDRRGLAFSFLLLTSYQTLKVLHIVPSGNVVGLVHVCCFATPESGARFARFGAIMEAALACAVVTF
jgi:hypothetical protein